MTRQTQPTRELAELAAPALVLATMLPIFRVAAGRLGPRLGYFVSLVLYWIGWCGLFPLWMVGRRGVRRMFWAARPHSRWSSWQTIVSIGGPVALAYGAVFPQALKRATPGVVLGSLAISLVNGVGEEVLWRGMYLRSSTRHRWLGYLWPAVGFALWHYAPLSVQPNRRPGGNHSFVAVCLALGLLWGNAANRTGSIRWTAAAHVLFDLAGLGALLYVPTQPLPRATASATFTDHAC